MAAERYRIIMFPWLAFGHMIPFLELSKILAAKGISISYISTPKNLQRLPPIPSNLEDKLNLLEIPLPSVDGLPENCEATIDLQEEQIQYLKKAYDKLSKPFENLLIKIMPDMILIDFAPYWIPEIAAKFDIPTAYFSVFTAATLAYTGPVEELKTGKRRPSPEYYTRAPDWIPFPSLVSHRPDFAPIVMKSTHSPDSSGISMAQRMAKVVENCSFLAVRSCKEFEGEYINLIQQLHEKPVLPIGVLHIVPFLWILRKPEGVDSSDVLPPGFGDRTRSQGVVILGWAPQVDILAHSAIGGCLFHAGWGTIVEALGFGHPLILLSMVADQGLNAKLLVEKELGYEVPRNEDGSFSREMVAESIRRVMVEPESEKFRSKAAQMRSNFDNKESQNNYINKFIEHMEKYLKKTKQV